MALTHLFYCVTDRDFLRLAYADLKTHEVTAVVYHFPTQHGAHRVVAQDRVEWDDMGYDAQQGVWAALCWQASHPKE